MHGIVQFLSMATTAQAVSIKGCCAGLALYTHTQALFSFHFCWQCCWQ